MKKKYLCLLFSVLFVLSLAGCTNGKNVAEDSNDAVQKITPEPTDTPLPTSTPTPTDTPLPTPTPTPYDPVRYTRQVEKLDRGLVAIAAPEGIYLSWRLLGPEMDIETSFEIYKNGNLISTVTDSTNYLDKSGNAGDEYTVKTIYGDASIKVEAESEVAIALENAYIEIPVDVPKEDTFMKKTSTYFPGDCSVADLDGDGEYEIILKWDPSQIKDNSQSGVTGMVYIDAYKLDGTKLWRITLGRNIRAGAHYTQFMVYDFDGDGKAEMIVKTGDGAIDGEGTVLGQPEIAYVNGTTGHITRGPEFLTLFDGETGKALDTIDYEPARGVLDSWGDSNGNRSERYLAAVAYLDGVHPSCIMSRGYYARTAIAAYDVVDKKLVMRWKFDTIDNDDYKQYMGQGNHNLAVADVDGDGYDEICFGQLTMNEDGTPLACTGLGHGDAMHVGDLVLDHPGVEAWGCLEAKGGAVLWNPADADILFRLEAKGDTGRGAAGNFVAGNRSYEFASSESDDIMDQDGNVVGVWPSQSSKNYATYWDADLEHEILDGDKIYKVNEGRIFTATGCVSINGTKRNTCITADILGDWREETVLPTEDGKAIRIYISTDVTDVKLFTLMHDTQYRVQVASQNVAYNQGALTSFFLGTGFDLPSGPDIYYAE